MKKIIIIPDVHGRKFWKEAVKERDEAKVIFLGDYLDPYDWDTSADGDCILNFREIVEYKEANPDDTILLVGNHDRHYMENCSQNFCRYRYSFYVRAKKDGLYERAELKAIHEEEINGIKFLFSHAGVTKGWLRYAFDGNTDIDVEQINKTYQEIPGYFDGVIPYSRGGWFNFGSPIWSDIRDFSQDDVSEYIQIVGHTQLESNPICRFNNIYDLDCRRAFYIDENGKLNEMDGSPIKLVE